MRKFWLGTAVVGLCALLAGCGAGAPTSSVDAAQQTMDPYERTGNVLTKRQATIGSGPTAAAVPPTVQTQAPPATVKAQ